MVHPILSSTASVQNLGSIDALALAGPIIDMLSRLHVLVIGPGLGRDRVTQLVTQEVMKEARSRSMPFVLDADALLLVIENPDLVKGYPECILTPNIVEFGRLAKAFGVEAPSQNDVRRQSDQQRTSGDLVALEAEKRNKASDACGKLARALGGVTILQKGRWDVISNGVTSIVSDIEGGLKRTGGQGDTLTGSLGTFLAWRASYHEGLWDDNQKKPHEGKNLAQLKDEVQPELEDTTDSNRKLSPATSLLLAAYAGSSLTRECSRRAFKEKGRSLLASDLTDHVHDSFLALIGEPKGSQL
jgi:ATP-dependent NAD(P)H-hydrate dehydratase